MAKRMKAGDSGAPDRLHNSGARRDTIKAVFRELQTIDDKSAEVNEERKKLLNTRVKGELGMKITDFRAAYRLYQLEDDGRDEMLDTLRECFDALGKGEQLDFLKVTERRQAREVAPAEAAA